MDLFRQKIKSQAAALSIFGQTLRPILPKTPKDKFMKKTGVHFSQLFKKTSISFFLNRPSMDLFRPKIESKAVAVLIFG